MRIAQAIVLGLCGCMAVAPPGLAQRPAPSLSSREQAHLQTLAQMLSEQDRSTKTRFQAATLLLDKSHPAATGVLAGFLADKSNRPAGVAIARAVAETRLGRPEFVEPLLDMLADGEASVRTAAAAALGTYNSQGVLTRLTQLAHDTKVADTTRLASILALTRVLDKQSIDTLISLLDDPEPNIRAAAAAALAKLTGIRSFGTDAARWHTWWRDNKNKSRQQWLADLAETLAGRNAAQDAQILKLRARLVDTLGRLYDATAEPDRPKVVLELLTDPLADVRLVGMNLATKRLAAGRPLAEGTRDVVRALLDDHDRRIRAAAAVLSANLIDAKAVAALLKRLEVETVADVRTALVKALGAMPSPAAADPLLKALADEPDGTAVEAAAALKQLAAKTLLSQIQVTHAEAVIARRYAGGDASRELREALLSAMRILASPKFAPAMRSALADKVAAIRLEAISGLQKLNLPESANDIAPLADDEDRGVRQAAITALGVLGDVNHLDKALRHMRSDVEDDPTVRKQAWETVESLLAKADSPRIADVAEQLAGRDDAREHHIRVLTMLVSRLADDAARQVAARRTLANALLAARRPAEAAETLAKAYEAAEKPNPAAELWLEWMVALLAADDAACLGHMAEQSDQRLFDAALDHLMTRLIVLQSGGKDLMLITLAERSVIRLKERLSPDGLQAIRAMWDQADARRRKADHARVVELLKDLIGGEQPPRTQARKTLVDMGMRAREPLVEQLRAAVGEGASNPALEQAIAKLLAEIAPELTGYDTQASPADKRKVIDAWLEELRS